MIYKKPSILFSSYSSLQTFHQSSPQPTTSCRHALTRPSAESSRCYAQVAEPPNPEHEQLQWPEPIPPARTPSPYQILQCKKGAIYSKARFYELVKLYHPDRTTRAPTRPLESRHVPQSVCLERYRLIIAAHTILSNPSKRSAYDRYGAGWAPHLAPGDFTSDSGPSQRWRPGEDPMQNATWEDWERWYKRDQEDSRREAYQAPVYISNAAFVSVILAFAAVGGFGQVTRANSFSSSIISHRDMVHAEASRELMRARQEARANEGRQGSIDRFLAKRNGPVTSEQADRRLLPEPEVCSGEVTRDV